MAVTGSAFLDFVIGFAVSLIASVMNAAGLNLLKLDHVRNSALPTERQRNECGRPLWHIGLYLYIASQLAGSTIALSKCLYSYVFTFLFVQRICKEKQTCLSTKRFQHSKFGVIPCRGGQRRSDIRPPHYITESHQ